MIDKIKKSWLKLINNKGWKNSIDSDIYYDWLKSWCSPKELYYYWSQVYEDLTYVYKGNMVLPVNFISINENIKPVFAGEDQVYFPDAFDFIFDKLGKNLSELELVRSNINGLPLAVCSINENFNFRDFVNKEVKANYKPHLFGAKSEHLQISYERYTKDSIEFLDDYYIFETNFYKKWDCFLIDTFIAGKIGFGALGCTTDPVIQLIRVDGKPASLLFCFEVRGDLVLEMISVLQDEEFKPYSLYAVAHLDAIRWGQLQGYKHVRCGDISLGNKHVLGFTSTPIYSIDFSDSFKKRMGL